MNEIMIDREKYYKDDYEGFAIFLITRAYNDLQINTTLFNKVKGDASYEAQIYFFKLLTAHLKETLKILGTIKRSDRFTGIMAKWENNVLVKRILLEIADELENPRNKPNTINAKYLNFRNEVFHYCIESKDFEEYTDIQEDLKQKNMNVLVSKNKKGQYEHEVGVDIQISQGIFNEKTIEEVDGLRRKVQTILREILNDYLIEKT